MRLMSSWADVLAFGDYLLFGVSASTKMGGHALPLVEDLYDCGSRSHFHQRS